MIMIRFKLKHVFYIHIYCRSSFLDVLRYVSCCFIQCACGFFYVSFCKMLHTLLALIIALALFLTLSLSRNPTLIKRILYSIPNDCALSDLVLCQNFYDFVSTAAFFHLSFSLSFFSLFFCSYAKRARERDGISMCRPFSHYGWHLKFYFNFRTSNRK